VSAICDVFDALLSARPYKEAWSIDRALAEIERVSGSQFDPGLVHAFLGIARELHREWFPADEGAPSEAHTLSTV
jgi:HD-GYP domain-containing protein (c-di-GMP phosphodiesterase class II)